MDLVLLTPSRGRECAFECQACGNACVLVQTASMTSPCRSFSSKWSVRRYHYDAMGGVGGTRLRMSVRSKDTHPTKSSLIMSLSFTTIPSQVGLQVLAGGVEVEWDWNSGPAHLPIQLSCVLDWKWHRAKISEAGNGSNPTIDF
jgi:hypothetical protein